MVTTPGSRAPLVWFFGLATAFLVPFLLLGGLTGVQLAPGLPIAALGVFSPMLAALVVSYRLQRRAGAAALLRRALDARRIDHPWWYLPLLLTMPAVMVVSFVVQRVSGVPVPVPEPALGLLLALCLGSFVGAVGEELGWSGFALDRMLGRWSVVQAGVLLGLFGALYHYVGLIQAHRSLEWIAWWTLYALASRMIMVWLFARTGRSVFGMVLFHMTINVTWLTYPVDGSFFDPRVTGLVLAVVAVVLVVLERTLRAVPKRCSRLRPSPASARR